LETHFKKTIKDSN